MATLKKAKRKKAPVKRPEEAFALPFGKIAVKISNYDKIYFPKDKITKGDVIEYYQQVAPYILPYLKNRPESLKRNPNGILDEGFYHKDAGDGAPEWVATKKIFSESANKDIDYILCNNKATLAFLNNLGCIEINPWASTIQKLDQPSYMVIDIDPSEKNSFEEVIEAAQVIKSILDEAGAKSYCKTSGATGLHIYVPTGQKYSYEQVKDFAHLICTLANEQIPSITSLVRSLAKRNKKHIYLDYLQNRRGQTIAAPYSLRPKSGATVSMPLLWSEVKKGLSPGDFTIHNAVKQIARRKELFKPVLGKGINLEKCLDNLSGTEH